MPDETGIESEHEEWRKLIAERVAVTLAPFSATRTELRDCASASPHTGHTWSWDGCRMWCNGRAA